MAEKNQHRCYTMDGKPRACIKNGRCIRGFPVPLYTSTMPTMRKDHFGFQYYCPRESVRPSCL